MENLLQSQIFFLISSIGFIILGVMAGVFLYYLIVTMKVFHRIITKIEGDISDLGDTSKEILDDLRDSPVYRFIFGSRRVGRKKVNIKNRM